LKLKNLGFTVLFSASPVHMVFQNPEALTGSGPNKISQQLYKTVYKFSIVDLIKYLF
jgi:hypothetical protein